MSQEIPSKTAPCSLPSETKPARGELYEHYKGGTYVVLDLALHTETKEELVVYQSLEYNSLWVRPLSVWFSPVLNSEEPRFKKIGTYELTKRTPLGELNSIILESNMVKRMARLRRWEQRWLVRLSKVSAAGGNLTTEHSDFIKRKTAEELGIALAPYFVESIELAPEGEDKVFPLRYHATAMAFRSKPNE